MKYIKSFVGFTILLTLIISSCNKLLVACIEITQKPDEIVTGDSIEFKAFCSQNADSYAWVISDSFEYSGPKIKHLFDTFYRGNQKIELTVSGNGGTETRYISVFVNE